MNRTVISILFGVGFTLLVMGSIVYIGGLQDLSSCLHFACGLKVNQQTIGLLTTAALMSLPGSLFLLIAWITVLVKQGQRRQWGWLVCTIFFRDITMLLWLILEPEVSSTPSARGRYR